MQVKVPFQVVLLVRGEGSKSPVSVMPHEVPILKVLHGEDSVQETNDQPPCAFAEIDTEVEFAELRNKYRGNSEIPDPVGSVFRNLAEFERAYAGMAEEEPDEESILLARAKELGIKATRNWGIPKLKAAIAEAEAAE